MNFKIYTAYSANITDSSLQDLHLTTSFSCIKDTSKLYMNSLPESLNTFVSDVVYWDHCDLTVALLDFSEDLCKLIEDLSTSGFIYDHVLGYKPHLTLGRGDLVDEYRTLQYSTVLLDQPYIRVKSFKLEEKPVTKYWYIASDVEGCYDILHIPTDFAEEFKEELESLLDHELLFEWYTDYGCLINVYGKYALICTNTKTENVNSDYVVEVLLEKSQELQLDSLSQKFLNWYN